MSRQQSPSRSSGQKSTTVRSVPKIDPRWILPDEADKPEPWVCKKCGKVREARANVWTGTWTVYDGPCEACEAQEFREESLRQARKNVLRKYGLVGGKYEGMSFATYRPDPKYPSQQMAMDAAMKVVEEWKAGNWSRGIILASEDVGIGKTHLAISMAREGVQFYSGGDRILAVWGVPTLLKRIRDSYDNGGPAELMRSVTNSGIVVLDDLGREHYATESWYKDLMYEIFNERWLSSRATIITTNKGGAELVKRLGTATFSRLKAVGGKAIQFSGEDYRSR